MGAIKEVMMEFCAAVYPDDWDKQDKLFEDIMEFYDCPAPPGITIEQYRASYERGEHFDIGLDDMQRLIEEFQKSGQNQSRPALTLRRVYNALFEQPDPVCTCGKTSEGICPRCGQNMNKVQGEGPPR